jgi:hypothetical protein
VLFQFGDRTSPKRYSSKERTMTAADNSSTKGEGLLTNVAETIGSTLGALAAKASAAQKSLGKATSAMVSKATSKRRIVRKRTGSASTKKAGAKRTAKATRLLTKRPTTSKKKRTRAR